MTSTTKPDRDKLDAPKIRERLKNRPDSEHEQAIIRIVIVAFLACYFLVLSLNSDGAVAAYRYGTYFGCGTISMK